MEDAPVSCADEVFTLRLNLNGDPAVKVSEVAARLLDMDMQQRKAERMQRPSL